LARDTKVCDYKYSHSSVQSACGSNILFFNLMRCARLEGSYSIMKLH